MHFVSSPHPGCQDDFLPFNTEYPAESQKKERRGFLRLPTPRFNQCLGQVTIPPRFYRIGQSKAMSVFQTFQTLPTRSGPGLRTGSPGIQPAGVASVPLLARTNW